MMRYRYEVDENNVVKIWDDQVPNEYDAPFIIQPDWPNTTPWGSRADAENWAEVFIEHLENESSEFVPGDSPENHPKPRTIA